MIRLHCEMIRRATSVRMVIALVIGAGVNIDDDDALRTLIDVAHTRIEELTCQS